jgi:hypothetical protein
MFTYYMEYDNSFVFWAGRLELDSREGGGLFFPPPCPNRLWGPTAHLHVAWRLKNVELYVHSPIPLHDWCLIKYRILR